MAFPRRRARRSGFGTVACSRLMVRGVAILFAAGAARAEATRYGAAVYENQPFHIGVLDGSNVAAAGPRLFFSPAEIERAKARIESDPAARTILERLTDEADEALELEIEPFDVEWWPAIQNDSWQETYPHVFEHTWIIPVGYAQPAARLATAWLLTGKQAYAEKAIALMMHLATYTFQAQHYDLGMNYSIWGFHLLKAYDALGSQMTAAQRRAVDDCLSRLAHEVLINHVFWVANDIGGGINNHLAWHNAMLGLVGLFYDRPEMVEYCLTDTRGLVPLLEDGLLDHGLWRESSLVYQFAAIAPMLVFARAEARMEVEKPLSTRILANGRTLKQGFDAMIDVLAPDGIIPPIGDAYAARRRLWEVPLYEQAWALWGDPNHAWLVTRNPEPSPDALFMPPLPERLKPPPIRSILLPEHGYVFLRTHSDADYWCNNAARCAFVTYDRSSVHANADKLSLMWFGEGRMLLSDVEGKATAGHAFSSRIQRELNRGALSQNTIMIDGADQTCRPQMLRLIEYRDLPTEKRVSAGDLEGILYEGVRQMRSIALTDAYMLDVLQVACDRDRRIDWVVHVMDEKAELVRQEGGKAGAAEPFALPEEAAWQWLRDAVHFKVDGPIELAWQQGDVRVGLHMLDPGDARIILCGYPATDEPDSGSIPMTLVRRIGTEAVFAAVWTVGDKLPPVSLVQRDHRDGQLVYEVTVGQTSRVHLVPTLERVLFAH